MAYTSPAIVNEITGRAWIRHSDGSLSELHHGSKVPAGSDVVTASGASVSLQFENGMPLIIGADREVALTSDIMGTQDDPSEAAVNPPEGTDSDRLLAALRDGRDPFDELDPTAAVVTSGGDAGGSSFVRLARVLETTNPLDQAYSNPARSDDALPRVSNAGTIGGNDVAATPVSANNALGARDDMDRGDQNKQVRDNLPANDSEPDGGPPTIPSIGDHSMPPQGITIAGNNGGSFTIQSDGNYIFDPGGDGHLAAVEAVISTASHTITASNDATSTEAVSVTITGVNDAPALLTHTNQALEDHSASGNVLSGATDADNDTLTVTTFTIGGIEYAVGSTAYVSGVGALTINADGSYIFTPHANWNGAVPQITYTVTDGTTSVSSTLNIDILPVNDAPVSHDSSGNVAAGGGYVFGLNDFPFSDPGEGHSMKSVFIDSLPSGGVLLLDGKPVTKGQEISAKDLASGKLVFKSDASFFGKKEGSPFDFRVKDTGGTANGGVDTSHQQTFKLNPGKLLVGDNSDDRPLKTGDGNNVVLGDRGGVQEEAPRPPDPAERLFEPDSSREPWMGGKASHVVAPLGNDHILGGDGSNILFGDSINTDRLPWGIDGNPARPVDLLDGSGLNGLKEFLFLKNGAQPTDAELHKFIWDNHEVLDVHGDTRGGDDLLVAGSGDDILYGQGGNDTLKGGDGNDILSGGTGNDILDGEAGNDFLIGGMGNDTLYGGTGSDTFKWALNDQGSTNAPAVDTIKDFSTLKPAEGGDILDLKELLVGERDSTLSQYLNFHKEGANTVIDINTQGKLDSQGADQKIVLENVDLTHDASGQFMSNQAIINDLLQKGKLAVDHG